MNPTPTSLALESPGRLLIEWSDGRRRRYDVAELRRACPCATCETEHARAERTGQPRREPQAGLTIRQMKPVGNYAYKIAFSDGHDTGIYRFELLRRLGWEAEARDEG
jgi:DUF971 family protein